MVELREVKVTRILNPTSIDLGEYVINPYKGCELSCLYCYVRSNRVVAKEKRPWGSYVDVRMNAPELLKKELSSKKPKCVLLGSTTECFQPAEERYQLMRKILEILNEAKVNFVILTRSPYICEYMSLLKEGFCKKIYFTVNHMKPVLKKHLEPKSPAFEERYKAIDELFNNTIGVVPYFSPLLPGISNFKGIFLRFPQAETIEFEGLNFNLSTLPKIISVVSLVYPELQNLYEKMLIDKVFYESVWRSIKKEVAQEAALGKKDFHIYIHCFGNYFRNRHVS